MKPGMEENADGDDFERAQRVEKLRLHLRALKLKMLQQRTGLLPNLFVC